jgi:hypothetical protein
MGISTTCLGPTSTAVGDGLLKSAQTRGAGAYVDVEDEVVAGMASATARSAAHNRTENFMLRIRDVEEVEGE